nr:MAG TPA: hypothetical protein [Caudoviricetes sp.]
MCGYLTVTRCKYKQSFVFIKRNRNNVSFLTLFFE